MTPNESQREADRLYAYIKGELPAGAPDLPAAEAELAAALKVAAQRIQPDAEFEASLEYRLTHRPRPRRTPLVSSAAFSGLVRLLAWGGMAAALLFGLVWVFQNVLPRSGPAAVSPVATSAVAATPTPTPFATATLVPPADQNVAPPPTASSPVYSSPLVEGGLMLKAEFPGGPESVTVYQQLPWEAITLDSARQMAQRFGLEGPVYLSPYGEGASTNYMLTDGVARITFADHPWWFHYDSNVRRGQQFNSPLPPAETLIAQAESFLKDRGLLDFPYQAEIPGSFPNSVQFLSTLDNLPVRHETTNSPNLQVTFDTQGQVVSVISNQLNYQPVGSFPILTAEQAWKKFTDEALQGGATFSDSFSFQIADYQSWIRQYQAGQQVELFGYLTRYKPAEPGNEALLTLDGYPLTGKTDGLVEFSSQMSYMQVWGTFETGGNGQLVLNVAGWQKSNFPDTTTMGTISKQDEKAYLETEAGEMLLLPDLPPDVPEGIKVMVQGARVEQPEPGLVWSTISTGEGGGGGGGGGGMGFAALNLSGQPAETPNAPTATPLPPPSELVKPDQPVEGAQGNVWVTIHTYTDGASQMKPSMVLDPAPDWPEGLAVMLEGPAVTGIEAYHQQPVKVWGTFQATAEGTPVLRIERIEPAYPDLKPQVWFGTAEVITLDGREVILFTDNTDNQEYILQTSIDNMDPEHTYWQPGDTVAVEGMAMPGSKYAEYPVIKDYIVLPVNGDTRQYQPQSLTPPVINEQTSSTEPRLATVEKIELVYITGNPRNGAAGQDDVFYVQPAWRFTGHTNAGQGFEILVQALDPQYLK